MPTEIKKTEKYFVHNSTLIENSSKPIIVPDNVKVFYEVIRVINSKPLFLSQHLQRLNQSLALSGLQNIDIERTSSILHKLLDVNPIKENNIKISYYCNDLLGKHRHFYAYFVESQYPSDESYRNGVNVELLSIKRNNPNIKLENPTLRGSADKILCLSQTHEALLVDDEGFITEGSRSNFFAVFGQSLVTPPAKHVLKGITREVVIELAKGNSIDFIERPIHSSEIYTMDGSFITGTSTKVLPIKKVGDYEYKNIPEITKKLVRLYNELIHKIS